MTDERTARMIEDALYQRGIDSNVSHSSGGTFLVWVVDEAQLARACELTEVWLDQGRDLELSEIAKRGRLAKDERERDAQHRREQIARARAELARASRRRPTPLTWGLLGLCIAIYWLSGMPALGAVVSDELHAVLRKLAIADPDLARTATMITVFGRQVAWWPLPWAEPWRFVTPALVHHHILHLAFNMLVLVQLGRVLEMRHGSRVLFALALISAVLANVAQYEITGNPTFAGFSGVVYALLGFLWLRGRLDLLVGYRLTDTAIAFMLLWLLFGFVSDSEQRIANYSHLFGLAFGVLCGYVSAQLAQRH